MKAKQTTFYAEPKVKEALARTGNKKRSERINELILKGLTKEKEEKIKADYEKYAEEVSKTEDRKKNKNGISTNTMMAEGLFKNEDEPDDWY